MILERLLDGILVGISVSIPLGPIGVLCVQRTLSKGHIHGIFSGLGAAASDTIYAIIAGFSLSFVIDFIKSHNTILEIVGGLVFLILGLHIWRSNPVSQLHKQRRKKLNIWQDFISTFFLTISNPLAIFVFIAIFAGFKIVTREMPFFNTLSIILGVFMGASLWWFSLTSLVNFFRDRINVRGLYWINKISGSIIILIAVGTLIYSFLGDKFL